MYVRTYVPLEENMWFRLYFIHIEHEEKMINNYNKLRILTVSAL